MELIQAFLNIVFSLLVIKLAMRYGRQINDLIATRLSSKKDTDWTIDMGGCRVAPVVRSNNNKEVHNLLASFLCRVLPHSSLAELCDIPHGNVRYYIQQINCIDFGL